MKGEIMKEIHTYILRIKSANKRGYAERYFAWRIGPASAPYDHSGGPADAGAYHQPCYMAAQAVRHFIDRALEQHGEVKEQYK